jgi:hypothetical protein
MEKEIYAVNTRLVPSPLRHQVRSVINDVYHAHRRGRRFDRLVLTDGAARIVAEECRLG